MSRTEERARVGRMYAGLSALNELVARAASEQELLQGLCDIAVASARFGWAVVRAVDRESLSASIVARTRSERVRFADRRIDVRPGARSLVAQAFASGRPAIASGDELAARFPFPGDPAKLGSRAIGAYPLFRRGECVAVLVLDSPEPRAFEGETGALLERMARDVSHGLDTLAAGEELRRFRLALDHCGDMIVLIDAATLRFVDVNETFCRVVGYSRGELLAMRPDQLLPVPLEELERDYAELVAEPSRLGSLRSHYRCKDGSTVPFEASRRVIRSGERWLVVAIARDTRERDAAEQALRRKDEALRAREREVRRKDAYLRSLVESVGDAIAVADLDWRFLYVNPSYEAMTGWSAAEVIGHRFGEFTPTADIGAVREALARELERSPGPRTVRLSVRRRDGVPRIHEVSVSKGTGAEGEPVYVLAGRDITDRIRAEEALRRREQELRRIVEAAAEPLLLVDRDGRTLFANPAAAALFGRPAAELEGEPFALPLDEPRPGEARPADVEIALPGGGRRNAEMRVAATELEGREVLVVSLHDLSERKRYEAHIEHLANHDGLTGLPNRTLLRDRVEQAIAHARRTRRGVALLFVDLDRFKLVNDSWGHGAGDALLLEAGARLRRAVRDGDTVARLGGDEFVVLLSDLARPGDAAGVAAKLAKALAQPMSLGGREARVTASVGISVFPGDGTDLDSLLQAADSAMYRAKDAGRNAYRYYSAEMGEQARARIELEAGLRRAIERGELRLHYQPQVELVSGAVLGFEALLRWEHPERGLVAPGEFIPAAEESGLILPIGRWAMHEACRQAARWAAAGLGAVRVAVNLSARQFWEGSVPEMVQEALAASGLPAESLEVEITESVAARDLDEVTRSLEELRVLGVSVTIDDFGTGYSSLAYLRALPIQKLKIDRTFIRGIPADREATALVAEIVRLAHVLSLQVVAEGVETEAQAALLREAGCEAMQGYLVSRPLPADQCVRLLEEGTDLRNALDSAGATE